MVKTNRERARSFVVEWCKLTGVVGYGDKERILITRITKALDKAEKRGRHESEQEIAHLQERIEMLKSINNSPFARVVVEYKGRKVQIPVVRDYIETLIGAADKHWAPNSPFDAEKVNEILERIHEIVLQMWQSNPLPSNTWGVFLRKYHELRCKLDLND